MMAAIQLNDPDPLYWVLVYLAASVVAGNRYLDSGLTTFTSITTGMVLAGILIAFPGTIEYFMADVFMEGNFTSIYGEMTAEKPYIESAREFGGLFIAAIYLLLCKRNSA